MCIPPRRYTHKENTSTSVLRVRVRVCVTVCVCEPFPLRFSQVSTQVLLCTVSRARWSEIAAREASETDSPVIDAHPHSLALSHSLNSLQGCVTFSAIFKCTIIHYNAVPRQSLTPSGLECYCNLYFKTVICDIGCYLCM